MRSSISRQKAASSSSYVSSSGVTDIRALTGESRSFSVLMLNHEVNGKGNTKLTLRLLKYVLNNNNLHELL